MIVRDFDPEKDAKSWGEIDLTAVFAKNVKKQKIVYIKSDKPKKVIVDKRLNLTNEITFSITQLDKLNKGFTNFQKINCFMNVCLQSLLACPGFFNMLKAISDCGISTKELGLDPNGVLMKLVYC